MLSLSLLSLRRQSRLSSFHFMCMVLKFGGVRDNQLDTHTERQSNPLDKRLSKFAHIRYITEHLQIATHPIWPISISETLVFCDFLSPFLSKRCAGIGGEMRTTTGTALHRLSSSWFVRKLSEATVEIEYGKSNRQFLYVYWVCCCGSLAVFFRTSLLALSLTCCHHIHWLCHVWYCVPAEWIHFAENAIAAYLFVHARSVSRIKDIPFSYGVCRLAFRWLFWWMIKKVWKTRTDIYVCIWGNNTHVCDDSG